MGLETLFQCRKCGGLGMDFPQLPSEPVSDTMIRCKQCNAKVMTLAEFWHKVALATERSTYKRAAGF